MKTVSQAKRRKITGHSKGKNFGLTCCPISDIEPRPSFDSNHTYEETTRPGYSSLTINSTLAPGQQELLDRLQAMTSVLKQNQQTMDLLQRILETHELVPKKSPFQDPVEL